MGSAWPESDRISVPVSAFGEGGDSSRAEGRVSPSLPLHSPTSQRMSFLSMLLVRSCAPSGLKCTAVTWALWPRPVRSP